MDFILFHVLLVHTFAGCTVNNIHLRVPICVPCSTDTQGHAIAMQKAALLHLLLVKELSTEGPN